MIREAQEGDVEAICTLLETAFRRPDEAKLYRRLLEGDDLAVVLVALGSPSDIGKATLTMSAVSGGAVEGHLLRAPAGAGIERGGSGSEQASERAATRAGGGRDESAAPVTGVAILSHLGSPKGSLGLGPLAVAPEHSDRGIGKALIAACIERARRDGHDAIFVLGQPPYYTRSGFSVDAARPFRSDYPADFLMALELKDGALEGGGTLRYATAFAGL